MGHSRRVRIADCSTMGQLKCEGCWSIAFILSEVFAHFLNARSAWLLIQPPKARVVEAEQSCTRNRPVKPRHRGEKEWVESSSGGKEQGSEAKGVRAGSGAQRRARLERTQRPRSSGIRRRTVSDVDAPLLCLRETRRVSLPAPALLLLSDRITACMQRQKLARR
eukprot:1217079-Rhodomonas_salina.1